MSRKRKPNDIAVICLANKNLQPIKEVEEEILVIHFLFRDDSFRLLNINLAHTQDGKSSSDRT